MAVGIGFTQADLECLPDVEGIRYELIDGELFVSKEATEPHQCTCMVLVVELGMWNRQSGAGLTILTPGLVFPDGDNVIPDLVWISYRRRAEALDEGGHYGLAPEIVVEVLSPGSANRWRDGEVKLRFYSRRRVQESWIANWQDHTLEVHRSDGAALQLVSTLTDSDVLTSPLLPGFACPIESLWAPPLVHD